MPAKTRVVQTVFLILCVSMLALQSGCGTSGGGGEAPASNPAAELRLDLSTPSGFTGVVADGSSTVPIRIQVTNGLGAGLSGMAVTFATTAGTLSPSPVVRASGAFLRADEAAIPRQDGEERLTVTTDASGTAQALLTAGTRAQTALVTADVQGFRTSLSIAFVAGAPTRVQLAASPTMVNAGGMSTLTATVTDVNGNPNDGQTLTFSLTTNNSGATLSPTSGTTDINGQVTVMYTAGIMAGADTVRAQVTSNNLTGTTSITVTATPGGSGSALVTSIAVTNGATGPVPANGVIPVDITATVQGASGPLPGITVTFTTTAGFFATSMATTATAATNTNGVARVELIAPTSMATATVTASAGGFSATTMVVFEASPASIQLVVDSPQLGSAQTLTDPPSLTLTALVKDAANNLLSGIPVRFAADSGNIQVTSGTTGPTGTATALLTTGGNPRNRTIMVTATTGNLSSSLQVQVTGTTLTISGASALVVGAPPLQLSILLRDSGGMGLANQTVTLISVLGNTLSAPTVVTNATGQATFTVTAMAGGTDTIQASALGAMGTAVLAISSANFAFMNPSQGTEVDLNTLQAVTLHWDEAGVNQVGCTIDFFATRGNLTTGPTCPVNPVSTVQVVTGADGNATVNICSDNAGATIISAVITPGPGPLCMTSPSAQLSLEFVATMVDSLTLQAFPTTLGVNDPPAREDQRSVVTAIVRDARGNLVKDQRVSFSTNDVSGGRIEPPEAATDSFGRANATYIAGPAASAQDGVIVTASVGAVQGMVFLTVAQQPFFVTLGTSNVVLTPTDTTYDLPYSVLVTDANGNPVVNATVELNVLPTHYQKGFYAQVFNSSGSCIRWDKASTINATGALLDPDDEDQACNSEDLNNNGVLDASEDLNNDGILDPGEDRNNNGALDAAEDRNGNEVLDPENPATVPGSVVTDASGFAFFNVSYAREFTWVEVVLQARTTVAGTEAASQAIFFLPGAASDFNNCLVAPPGAISPYGVAITCGCDDNDPTQVQTCRVIVNAGPVMITPVNIDSTTLPTVPTMPPGGVGGPYVFSVTGGTQTSYAVTIPPGSGIVDPPVINFVPGGGQFTLTTTAAQNGAMIVITATDTVTGQAGVIILMQQ